MRCYSGLRISIVGFEGTSFADCKVEMFEIYLNFINAVDCG